MSVFVTKSALDAALTAQLVVGWAGEAGEEPRLGWWRSDLVSEFGGADLFRRLLPATWPWAVLQGAREVARRRDAELRRQASDPDAIVSLFSLGFELDERIEERLQTLKGAGHAPEEALPGLSLVYARWRPEAFWAWVDAHGEAESTPAPVGRRLVGAPPADLETLMARLVAAIAPAADTYPLPHFPRSPSPRARRRPPRFTRA